MVDAGAPLVEELLQVQLVEGSRLWFASVDDPAFGPVLVRDHPAGAIVEEVAITALNRGLDYDLTPSTGAVQELIELGTGTLVAVTYTSAFRVPRQVRLGARFEW